MKIAINTCYGGFSLSDEAMSLIATRKGIAKDTEAWYNLRRNLPRHDTDMIAVIETLGQKADGFFAVIKIIEIPTGTRYRIQEYDGLEWIETESDIVWETAT